MEYVYLVWMDGEVMSVHKSRAGAVAALMLAAMEDEDYPLTVVDPSDESEFPYVRDVDWFAERMELDS